MRTFIAVSVVLLLLLASVAIASEQHQHLLPLQGTVKKNGGDLIAGDIIVEIWDTPTGGNLLYNSSTDFYNVISGGDYDVLLGNGSQPLSLVFGERYYMEVYVNGTEVDFNGSERQLFMSNVGNVTMTTPISTNSSDTDDALNISNGGAYIGNNVTINNTINLTAATGDITIAGKLLAQSADLDDALNISNGGAYVSGNITTPNGLNVSELVHLASGAAEGGVIIDENGFIKSQNSDSAGALNMTGGIVVDPANGGSDFRIGAVEDSFRIDGGARNVIIYDTFNITTRGGEVRTNLTVLINNADDDGALNVTGGSFFGDDMLVTADIQAGTAASPAGSLAAYTREEVAFTINEGINISGQNGALSTNSTIAISGSPLGVVFRVNEAFNITDTGDVQIGGQDADSALNVSSGGAFFARDVVVGDGGPNGNIIMHNQDNDGVLNITDGGAFIGRDLVIGNGGPNGKLVLHSPDNDDVINVTQGGVNIRLGTLTVGDGGPDAAVVVNTMNALAFTVGNSFNISGNGAGVTTNETVTITSGNGLTLKDDVSIGFGGGPVDPPDATLTWNSASGFLALTNAGGAAAPALILDSEFTSLGYTFNVTKANSSVKTNATLAIESVDIDDALNVSGGIIAGTGTGSAFIQIGNIIANEAGDLTVGANDARIFVNEGGNINVGTGTSTTQHHVDIYDGGTDKCGYLTLYDEAGNPHYLFISSDNTLMVGNATPTACDTTDGTRVGAQ